MYKRTTFSLVLPENDKPLMLDDTCYFIGFDTIEAAQVAQKILNSELVQTFFIANDYTIFPSCLASSDYTVLQPNVGPWTFNITRQVAKVSSIGYRKEFESKRISA